MPLHADFCGDFRSQLSLALVSAGESHSFALDRQGRAWGWGRNLEGQLGLGDERSRWRPCLLRTLAEQVCVRHIAAATIHSAAIGWDGSVYTWGVDAGGRLGHGDGLAISLPQRVQGLACVHVQEIAAGREHTLFKLADGRTLSCGKGVHTHIVSQGVEGDALPPAEKAKTPVPTDIFACLMPPRGA